MPKKSLMEFDVLLEKDEDGVWAVSVPALPGCYSQGRTEAEALENVREAISLHLEDSEPEKVRAIRLERVTVEV